MIALPLIDSGFQRFQDIDAGESAIAEAIQQIDAQKQEAAGIPSVMGSPSQESLVHLWVGSHVEGHSNVTNHLITRIYILSYILLYYFVYYLILLFSYIKCHYPFLDLQTPKKIDRFGYSPIMVEVA